MSDDDQTPRERPSLPDYYPPSNRSFIDGCGNFILFVVGAFLLLVPGGCAIFGLFMSAKTMNANDLSMGATFILINAALAFAGFTMIRNALK